MVCIDGRVSVATGNLLGWDFVEMMICGAKPLRGVELSLVPATDSAVRR